MFYGTRFRSACIINSACFISIQPNVKVKILLSFLHLPRRQLDEPEWRQELNAIMETACELSWPFDFDFADVYAI